MNNTNKKTLVSPRVLTALVGIPIVLAIVHFGGWLLIATIWILAFVASRELEQATSNASTRIDESLCSFTLLISFIAILVSLDGFPTKISSTPHSAADIVAFVSISSLGLAVIFHNSKFKVSLMSLSLSVFAALYVSLFAFIPAVQSLPNGRALLWLTLFCVWTGDTLAYYGGRRFGKTKLTPLSPGKSREGALCGFLGSIAVGALIGHFTVIGTAHGFILGAFVGVFAPLGDLAESFWKRELGIKDLGTILPGHGGVLDRCDSLLFAAPTVYFVSRLLS